MNLNEVKKHVTFDLIFTLLVCIGVGLCLFLTLAYIFRPINASALTETPMTNGITAGQYCSSHPQASVCTGQTYRDSYGNPCGNGDSQCITYFSSYVDNNVMSINFYMNTSIQGYTANTLTLYGNGFANVNYNCSASHGSCSVVRVSSNQLNINFHNNNSTAYSNPMQFDIYNNSSSLNGNSSFRITSATLYQNDIGSDSGGGSSSGSSFDDSGIISNANQNTSQIIENNNTNTNSIINSVSNFANQFINMCSNLLDPMNWSACTMNDSTSESLWCQPDTRILSADKDSGSINYHLGSGWAGIMSDYIPIDPSLDYYFSFNDTLSTRDIIVKSYDINKNILQVKKYNASYGKQFMLCLSSNTSACFSTNARYIRISYSTSSSGVANTDYTLSSLKLNVGGYKAFCPYGSSTNKIDELGGTASAILGGLIDNNATLEDMKDIQQDTYDYITDDSNPTVDSSGIQNTINSVHTSNPLSYLLTLPTNLLSAIINGLSSDSCTDFEIGKFGHIGRHDLGTYTFKFPCINVKDTLGDTLYNTIDIFVSVGILVITIVKLYNTISSYLTLGAEDEVKAHSHFLTPMDFLGNILGGNISGIGNSLSSMNGGGNW